MSSYVEFPGISGGRTKLTADANYYISTTGSDTTGDGSIGNPWATPQHGVNVVAVTLDAAGFAINFNIADGTYPGPQVGVMPLETGIMNFTGSSADPTKVIFTEGDAVVACAAVLAPGVTNFQYMTFFCTTQSCFAVGGDFLTTYLSNVIFKVSGTGAYGLRHTSAYSTANLGIDGIFNNYGTLEVSGTFANFIFANFQGTVGFTGSTMTFDAGTTFTNALIFLAAESLCSMDVFQGAPNISGTFTGPFLNMINGSELIDTIDSITHFPYTSFGTIAGNSTAAFSQGIITGANWTIEASGDKWVSTQFNKTSDTALANIPGLSVNLLAGFNYVFDVELFTTSDVAGGVKVAIGGTCVPTTIIYEGEAINANTISGQTRATALGNAVAAVTAVTAARIEIDGFISVATAGTMTVQFAQNVADATASSVLVGSNLEVQQVQ